MQQNIVLDFFLFWTDLEVLGRRDAENPMNIKSFSVPVSTLHHQNYMKVCIELIHMLFIFIWLNEASGLTYFGNIPFYGGHCVSEFWDICIIVLEFIVRIVLTVSIIVIEIILLIILSKIFKAMHIINPNFI